MEKQPMKCLSIVIHETARENLIDQLTSNPAVRHWQVAQSQGRYASGQHNPFETASDKVTGHIPRVRFDILIDEQHIPPIVELVRMCKSCSKGRGLYWVTDLDDFGEL
jgi:nitrogen regulatory protein P-II 1